MLWCMKQFMYASETASAIKKRERDIIVFQREVTVANPTGFHARPAALVVAQATKSKSKVTILFNGKTINAKSILHVLGGGIRKGAQIVVTVDGEDEKETLADLCQLIEKLSEQEKRVI